MPTINELLGKRSEKVGQCRDLLTRAEADNRELTADERRQYDALWADVCSLKEQADQSKADDDRRRRLADVEAEQTRSAGRPAFLERPGRGGNYQDTNVAKAHTLELVRGGRGSRPGIDRHIVPQKAQRIELAAGTAAWARHQPDIARAYDAYLSTGQIQASLQTDISTAGGYMVLPEEFVTELLMNVDDLRWMRKLARVFTTTAQTLGVVKRTAKMASFAWGSELTDASTVKDTTLAYGKRSLTPHYMVGEIIVSRDLLRSALLPVREFIAYEIARDSGELEEKGFLTGNGTQQPLGVFTADANGIDTGRDISTANTTTTISADNLRACKYALKAQYQAHPSLAWLFHRDSLSQISRLKDGMGQYLWQTGITAGDPDRLLNIPVYMSEFSPNTFTTGLYVGILGAWYFYWIADSLEMDMMVLLEKYAETNQVAYLARRKTDGMPQIAEAFARVKLA